MTILPKNIKKQVDLFDFFDGFSVLHRMTEDEDRRYSEQVKSSGGFEVDPFPGVVAFGLIQPWDINVPDNARRCILYSHNAIDTYNTKYGTPQLKFVRVLKAMCQGCDVFRCYVTFEAKDLADGGQTKIYQAVVRCQIPIDVNISTLSFRECVQLVRGSGFHGKKWNWKGH
ncbi:uncharacterized protein LOC133867885 [Alnus glutinosa]|uniref:uncharacterized protein LOC133867885 n=1 Tax=Alnus glutinosa TaxID=3517 RepID=UPI002D77C0A2|nr:uncharacterized protein LOC133867885 [Alnus glutinosa]